MGLFNEALGSAVPGGNVGKPLLVALGALLLSGALHGRNTPEKTSAGQPSATPLSGSDGGLLGGLGGLLNRFQQTGYGDVVNSWIGTGANKEIAPHQLGSALGPDVIKSLAEKSGMSEQELMAQLSKVLPSLIDKLTPNGRFPTEAEIAGPR